MKMLTRPHPTDSPRDIQLRLVELNALRFNPSFPTASWAEDLATFERLSVVEGEYLETSRMRVSGRAAQAPTEPLSFIAWFEDLKNSGPGQQDPLFRWLAEESSLEQMKWFLTQEIAGEAGFDDLTALTQVKLPTRAKLELARNYWDEMGRGSEKGMHGPMLEKLARSLDLSPTVEETVEESLSLANTMAGLAANRRYAYHSVGALGVIEMTAPARSAATTVGLKRLGIRAGDRHYFALHAVLDVKHSASWNSEAILPLVSSDRRIAAAIAEGALMRLECGARCFERYRAELGLSFR